MVKITVCIGSSCHVKGSQRVIEELRRLIAANGLNDEVVLAGTFCSGNCQKGVCVTVNGEDYSVTPESAADFFQNAVIPGVENK
ncbi:MAG: (2Fe-2S) ferredoxin domain-containing protein [Clostridia bacterium]|nr:(2Fe-2S) ferredoxin domain-containing protein [Clostridia bacterium]